MAILTRSNDTVIIPVLEQLSIVFPYTYFCFFEDLKKISFHKETLVGVLSFSLIMVGYIVSTRKRRASI